MKNLILLLLCIFTFSGYAQNGPEYLTKSEVEKDLKFLGDILENTSSYQGLNGYNYQSDFDAYLEKIEGKPITNYDFELFVSRTLGKIGDRHSYIKGDKARDLLYFPIAFAPFNERVLVMDYDKAKKEYDFWNSEFPYLKSINEIPLEQLLPQVLPGDVLAPPKSYFMRAVRELRDIEEIFRSLNMDLPNPLPMTLTNDNGGEKKVKINLVEQNKRARIWDERFHKNNFFLTDKQSNDKKIIEQFFSLENNIGYIQIVKMLHKEDSRVFFRFLKKFMKKAQGTEALIIDVRDNGGGGRDLVQELAGHFVHPDSVYVVNATRQRGKLPLNKDVKKDLHNRFLFSRDELDKREQNAVDEFMTSFQPMYVLDKNKFSDYHYYVFNGQKITKNKYHYNKPIYILTNERSFSAASVLVSVFKGLPNIKIVGVNTDGSSGNSERFELPNSKLNGKISTMVSFQKNGKILDGIGTEPDILIERNLDQIFLKEDYQLNELRDRIKSN